MQAPCLPTQNTDMDIHIDHLVRPLGVMENLEKQLSCPICLDMFSRPVVILPCQHNLCRSCASDLFESRNPYHFSGGTFRCPTCRFEVVLDRHGVYGLQRNLLVENIIDIYKQQQESRGDHDEEPPLKDKDDKEPRCKEHEDERINIYCVSCQTPTCSMCKVFGQHKDCEVSPLRLVYQSRKSELHAAVELLAARNGGVQAAARQLEDSRRLVEESGERQRRRLGESCDLLFALLEERKAALLERISGEERGKVAVLRELADQYRQQMQLCTQLQEKLRQTMDRCGTSEFLLSAKQLLDEAQQAARAAHLKQPESGFEAMDHLRLDTREVEALLARMDFTQEGEQESS
ncbi:E3 ubiquitin-protein ligase TRIM63-like [Melanotaenia boesemani]|uniref:E3 ubiquitin-protein ligase TRIM63-like n=1 Tax=Melanotaenia boesemani TaxID=1250792 RepID=UPI001C03E911|nr:E3 ubiquitin-protein ligase TRIM63-like [Melanotaenia boesemani]